MKSNQLFLVAIILSLSFLNVKGQKISKSYDIELGISIPELYHAGFGYNYNERGKIELKLGADFGTIDDEALKALTLNHSWYFGRLNSKINKSTWSLNTGSTMLVENQGDKASYTFYLNLYACKDIPVVRKFFIRPELGVSYFLFEKSVSDVELCEEGYRIKLIPKFGLSMFYRL